MIYISKLITEWILAYPPSAFWVDIVLGCSIIGILIGSALVKIIKKEN
jgi:hypothetical protein